MFRSQFLTREIAALSGFKAIAKVPLPPLVRLVEMTHLHFVGVRMLCEPIAKSKVAIETHEFAEINIGDTLITTNDQHVLVVIGGGGFTKIGRTGNYQRVSAQRIDQHVFRMQVS